jgi:hypothetical protein
MAENRLQSISNKKTPRETPVIENRCERGVLEPMFAAKTLFRERSMG